MSGCLEQRWVSYAGDDLEAWKCLLLARSLKKTMSTRPLRVVVSDKVSLPMGRRLQDEVEQCYWVDPDDHPGLQFRSVAKLCAQRWQAEGQLHKTIFLDCSVLVVKNVDELFNKGDRGAWAQWMGKPEFAVIFAKSRSIGKKEQTLATDMVLQRETRDKMATGKDVGCGKISDEKFELSEFNLCVEFDMKSKHPSSLPGEELKIICFVNGHPFDNREMKGGHEMGILGQEMIDLCISLCPELYVQAKDSMDRDLDVPEISRELNNSIAIVGMACRYPCANTIDEFWNLLAEGREGIRKVPEGRWTKEKALIRLDNMEATEAGFLSCPVDTFDSKFWNVNAADMQYLDPQQRLSLRVVWEALEHAGIDPNTLKNSLTGVFGGWWRNDYKEMLQTCGIGDSDFLRGYLGNALGPLTARIAHVFELIGPAFSTESGCSTSIAGVDMACDSLRNDACDLAIAVGANLLLHPFSPNLMEGVLAPDGRCKTFDASADGFGRAEGIGVLILKRFANAVADGDRIWGIIRGSAVVQEGPSKSMGTPTVDVEAKAMQLALERSGVSPNDVEFVESHGTGTPVGDPIEVAAIAKAYSVGGRSCPLIIGSVKTNIGHTESVCGIAGIQKSVLAMKYETIPKHLHIKNLNPEIDLTAMQAQIPLEPISWKRRGGKGAKPRIAGINSFGITGAQAHILVQEPPLPKFLPKFNLPFRDSRSLKMLTFSAKTDEALKFQGRAYASLLQSKKCPSLTDMEYSMHTGRPHMSLRHVVLGKDQEELVSGIESMLKSKVTPIPNMVPKVCLLFTGQGSQYSGMSKELYDNNALFRSHFDWCESVLRKDHGIHIKDALWGNTNDVSKLKSTLYSQTSIFVVELCLLRLWESWGIKFDAVLGHSLGEFAAAVAAGIMNAEDALNLVAKRSKLIQALPKSSMLVVGSDPESVQQHLENAFKNEKKWLDIAAINSASQTVVAGSNELIQEFKNYCEKNKVKTHLLDSSHAFHSRFMDPMLKEYEEFAEKIEYKMPNKNCIFISGVNGKPIDSPIDAKYWIRHCRHKVRFFDACQSAIREGLSLFLELGPHPVLSTLLEMNVDHLVDNLVTIPSLRRNSPDWSTILSSLGKLYTSGCAINWENFHRYSRGQKVDLPGYHFEETHYWMNIKDEGATPFHPLLGAFIPNPSDVTIFKSSVNVHRLPFLKDHALGDKIIFPCVGYVDLAMTAGYAATQCTEGSYSPPTSPLCIRNFSISTPVCLSEMTPTEFNVVVTKGETINCKIYTKLFLESNNFKWVLNASASFSSTPPPLSEHVKESSLEEIKERCSELLRKDFNYAELEEFGFHFGPSCRTVSSAWNNPNDKGEWLFQFSTHEKEEDHSRFIIHPWCTDPMLQTQIIASGLLYDKQVRKRLVVPVSIDNYTWWGHSSPSGYVYIKNGEAHLYDPEGKVMVSMVGTEFMDTTLPNILALIDSHKNPFPSLAEYAWKEQLGPQERRLPTSDLEAVDIKQFSKDEVIPKLTPEEEEQLKSEDELCGLYMLKGLVEGVGFEWEAGKTFCLQDLKTSPQLAKFLRYIIHQLVGEGWFKEAGKNCFKVLQALPPVEKINIQIATALNQSNNNCPEYVESATKVWAKLGDILSGKLSALSILFPDEDQSKGSVGPAELYYTKSLMASKRHFDLASVDLSILTQLTSSSKIGPVKKVVVRILEIGAGVGSSTRHLIKHMESVGVSHFEYTYTDLSQFFLSKGEALFQDTGIASKFSILDIEKDPLEQGFIPKHYDLIVVSWVLHATAKIRDSLQNLKMLLRPGGLLLITELTKPSRPINLMFGGLEGFWKFKDFEWRPYNCEMELGKWKLTLEQIGFRETVGIPICRESNAYILTRLKATDGDSPSIAEIQQDKNKFWIIFGEVNNETTIELRKRLETIGFSTIIITNQELEIGEHLEENISTALQTAFDTHEIIGIIYLYGLQANSLLSTSAFCRPYLYICKYLATCKSSLKLVLVTKGNMCVGSSDYYQSFPHPSPLLGMTNVLGNENPEIETKCVDLDPLSSSPVKDLFSELFLSDVDVNVAYRSGGQRCSPRLRPYKVKAIPLQIPKSSRFRLILPHSRLIQDLQFAPCDPEPLGEAQVEVEVKSYALNFLDVLMVTKPDPVFEKYNYLGVDIAGVVSAVGKNACRKVGDRVVMIRRSGLAMPSHLIAPDYRTLVIPDEVTYNEAATFPMGMLTIASCLVDTAKAKKGDVVLIHTASGGVGLFGIQIAQRLGCVVVVTAGNERKRSYLRSLGVNLVFNSRNTEYGTEIRKALGRGVDIVLNSLTGKGFKEATLGLCEQGARFVEMSKMNIWSESEVKKLRPDVFYKVVDVSAHSEEKITQLTNYLQKELLKENTERPKPLPFVRFDAADIRDALDYMEKVKHIGKIVLTMPDQTNGISPLFNGISTYMITGGLGGIGLEVSKWMGANGAKTILLIGRTIKAEALEKVEQLRAQGLRIEIRGCDVGNLEEMEKLFSEFKNSKLPPLRGIIHAAGLLDDATYEKQNWEKYERVFRCKVEGAWNLHNLSTKLSFPLEHFVLFSSVTATVGAHGQSNYVAGNQFLDSLAHYRTSLGLPATSINWGQWGQVGIAANMHVPMNKPMTIHQGLAALEHAIKSHKTQIVAHEADLPAIKQVLVSTRGLLAEIEEDSSNSQTEMDGDEFWREYDNANGKEDEVVRKFLKRLIRITLKLDKNEEVDDNVSFQDMGIDSLLLVELKNGLQASVGKRVKISFNAVRDCKTVAQLSGRLVELISGKKELPPPTEEELKALVEKDATLSATILVDPSLVPTLCPLEKVSKVLLIGATGTVGPYILRELLKRPQISKVICLITPAPLVSAQERLWKILDKKGLSSQIPKDKVECLAGDVKEPFFGLSEDVHNKLSFEVDAVFNLAVKVVFDELYRETDDPKSCRVINVFGMRNVLSFAVEKKLKYVYHASTFAAETQVDEDGQLWEGWPKEEEIFLIPQSAYSISKLICDRLAEQAVERGVPCKVFRLPQIGGDSVTGGNVQLDSFLMRRCLSYLYTGYMHSSSVPLSLLAVDQAAALSLKIFFNPSAAFDMYNVLNPHLGDERNFESLAREFGITIKVLEFNEFVKLWKDKEAEGEEDEMVKLVKYALEKDDYIRHLKDKEMPYYSQWLAGNKKIFWSKKMERLMSKDEYPKCITPSWEVLRKDLKFARDSGVFDKYKIKHSNPYMMS